MTVKNREDCTPEELAERDAFAEKVRSISFAASAMPTRSSAADEKKAWKKLDKDMDAYKRLRGDGVQPASMRNSADLESRAETKMEIESGTVVRDRNVRKATEELLAD